METHPAARICRRPCLPRALPARRKGEKPMCLICERILQIRQGTNPYFVKELQTGYIVLGDHQHFKGYTLFLCKEHKSELFHLEPKQKTLFLEEMSVAAQAVSQAFGAEKMNCELLGNGDAHLHWHLFPRISGDLEGYGNQGKGPVWWYPRENMYAASTQPSPQCLREMKPKLLRELETLIPNPAK